MTFSNPIIGGNDTLVRQAMQSEGFESGVAGWRIERDGDAEFNNVVVRGELDVTGTDGSYVRAVAQGGHADVLLNPQTVPGYTWDPAAITADVDAGGVGTDNPSLRITSPAGQGLIEPAAEIRLDGPGEFDQNAITLLSNSVRVRANSPTGVSFGVEGPLFAEDTFVDGDLDVTGDITLAQGKGVRRGPMAGLSLLAGWSNFGGGYQTATYVEMPDRTGQLFGVIGAGTTTHGTIIANVGASVRPSAAHVFTCTSNGGAPIQLALATNGNIVLQSPPVGLAWIAFGGGCRWPIAGF